LVRPGDTVARLGGDEFTILIQTVNGAQDATAVAERIRDHLTRPVPIEGQEVVVTASIGIAVGGSAYHGADDVLRDADIAMNRAKKLGRDRYEIFDPSMHRHAVALLKLENDLRRAVERDELVLHYQPILDLSSWKAVAVEALVRWHHPERGLLPPAEFLPVAEETGLITNIGEWALRVACRQAAAWRKPGGQPTPAISINLVSTQFTRPELVDFIKELLEANGVTPDCLQLEITEETIIDAPERAVEVVARLKALGIKVHLDDFGTGYSSLSYLQRFDVDSLKIDRSFVGRMTSDASSGELVEAIVTLAHALGMQALAEGIETPEQLLRLQQLGCEMGQGFYFSPPVDPEHIRTVLDAPRGRVN
jgi:EAL domain-containing protein (putative c-di-GMP-specific phosphodiesterase class I)